MKKLTTMLMASALALSALAVAPVIAGDTKDTGFAWKLTKGEKTRWKYSYSLTRTIELMGMPMPQSQKLAVHLTENTTDVTDGKASIEATIDRLVATVDVGPMMGGSVSYDTKDAKRDENGKLEKPKKKKKKDDDDDDDDDSSAGNALEPLAELVGEKFTFKMASDGTVSDLEGMQELVMKLSTHMNGGGMPRMGGDPSKMMRMIALPTVVAAFTPEVFQQTLDLHTHIFTKDAPTGDSWNLDTTQQIPGTGDISFKRTFTPSGDADAAGEKGTKIGHASNAPTFKALKLPPGMGGGMGGMGGMAAAMGKQKMKEASYTGSTVFSKDKGRILSDELVETMTTEGMVPNPMGGGGKKGKKKADDDDDDDAPKKKDDTKKDDTKKDDSGTKEKKKDDDDDDDGADANSIKLVQKFKLTLKYEIQNGDAAAPAPEEKKPSDDKKEPEKGKF